MQLYVMPVCTVGLTKLIVFIVILIHLGSVVVPPVFLQYFDCTSLSDAIFQQQVACAVFRLSATAANGSVNIFYFCHGYGSSALASIMEASSFLEFFSLFVLCTIYDWGMF